MKIIILRGAREGEKKREREGNGTLNIIFLDFFKNMTDSTRLPGKGKFQIAGSWQDFVLNIMKEWGLVSLRIRGYSLGTP